MNLKLLDVLRLKLGTAKEFATVFEYFLDHFGEDEDFINLGDRTEDELLEKLIEASGEAFYGPDCKVHRFNLIAIPNTPFIHGSCVVNGRPSNVLYFSDTRFGLLAILPTRRGELTHYSRFGAEPIPQGLIDAKDRN